MNIAKDICYVGVDDHDIDLFEGQYELPRGMAYNSYVIKDEKTVVMDSVESRFAKEWLGKIKAVLMDREPDYLVVQHMEPDHSSSILSFLDAFPSAKLVMSQKAVAMLKNFYGRECPEKTVTAGEGDTLALGSHTMRFFAAPMVHWPEVLMTYDENAKVLFSADAFGKFGANDVPDPEGWACEARRYYFGIVGKFGAMVQTVLKKLSGLEIGAICPLHGPVLDSDIPYYLKTYDTWSSYGIESEGVFIAYTSVYGHTKAAVEYLEKALLSRGCPKVSVSDLARDDMAEAVEDAFRYGKIVLATTTYSGDIFPFMDQFIRELIHRNYQNRKIGLVENGSWAPVAAKIMRGLLEGCKNVTFAETSVKILSSLSQENLAQLESLADEMLAD